MDQLRFPQPAGASSPLRAGPPAGARAAAADAAAPVPPVAGRASDPSLSCVVPCRDEARNLELLLPRLQQSLAALVSRWEIIVVDDGSRDDTVARVQRWVARGGVRLLELSRNFGKEAALTAGLTAARGDVVVMMDADLQHEPESIARLLQAWREGADTAYAVRRDRADEGLLKRLGTRTFYALVNAADRFEVPPDAGDFRLMDRCVVDTLLSLPERNRFMKGLYAWVGFSAVAVPYAPAPRLHGRSQFRPSRLVRLALDGLTGFTTWPLRAVSVTGFVLAVAAFVYGAFIAVRTLLYGNDVSGWATIVVGMMLFAGIQMVSLGIVGEYVARIFEEVKARPLYVVKRRSGSGLEETSP